MPLTHFLNDCLLLDLETTQTGQIVAIGACHRDESFAWEKSQGQPLAALERVNELARGAKYVVGHNILGHDLPLLVGIAPHLPFLEKPPVDTLFLSPLAFPRNPYHRLIKDYKLVRDTLNDPLADARLAGALLLDHGTALAALPAEQLKLYGACLGRGNLQPQVPPEQQRRNGKGLRDLFELLGGERLTSAEQAAEIWRELTQGLACRTALAAIGPADFRDPTQAPLFAYALAWLQVAGGNSVLPPWVRFTFGGIVPLLRRLRETPCRDPACRYCAESFDAVTALRRFFPGFTAFRAEPTSETGGSLQQDIVEAGIADRPLLAILPTGGGKSLCFQLPALARHQRRGLLTVVVSPLQALMRDQVETLERKTGTVAAAALYGALTLPERGAIAERVRMGDIGILYISPEQLRNPSIQTLLRQREIGCWVFDEAHCLSKWGNDFRPDYLYAARAIKAHAEATGLPPPPVACFTATARKDVIDEIQDHFKQMLNQELELHEGGVDRANLKYVVLPAGAAEKMTLIGDLLAERLPPDPSQAAIVFCATRDGAEVTARRLAERGFPAEAYHAGLKPAERARVQTAFIDGPARIVAATNAFGMGIDKDAVRLVIHADMPGSLENYLQEAGRAGRDTRPAECILLYDEQDVERQFKMGAAGELSRRAIGQVLIGIRRAAGRLKRDAVVMSTAEIAALAVDERDLDLRDHALDTKVKTAVAWLEKAGLLRRDENANRVIGGRPRLATLAEAGSKIDALGLPERVRAQWRAVYGALLDAATDTDGPGLVGIDALAALDLFKGPDDPSYSAPRAVLRVVEDMIRQGLVADDAGFTAEYTPRVSRRDFDECRRLEAGLIAALRKAAPDGGDLDIGLRQLNQRLTDAGFEGSQPVLLRGLLRTLVADGGGRAAGIGLRQLSGETYRLTLADDWPALLDRIETRTLVAAHALDLLQAKARAAGSEARLILGFTLAEIADRLRADMALASLWADPMPAIERALLMLHDRKAIRLQQGLSVFRQAMTLRLPEGERRAYTNADHKPLDEHYQNRRRQVHVMKAFAERGQANIGEAMQLARDYFDMTEDSFLRRYFRGRREELARPVSPALYRRIVEDLRNLGQQEIVTAPLDADLLVLAGPGSGKSRTIVHRAAYLLKVERVPPTALLIVCFNRSAAMSLRRRLKTLVGDAAAGVDILTYHALAMRIVGASFDRDGEAPAASLDADPFAHVLERAVDLLVGKTTLPGLDAGELLAGLQTRLRYILIDEYQDIDRLQYELISILAGKAAKRGDNAGITLMAVGDDDQTVYGFRGADVRFIRQFQQDYAAEIRHLIENYRSSKPIIEAANAVIETLPDRMKQSHPIRIDDARADEPAGPPITIFDCRPGAQAAAAVAWLKDAPDRLDETCILARTRADLDTVRAACRAAGIPVRIEAAGEPGPDGRVRSPFPLRRLREAGTLLDRLGRDLTERITPDDLRRALAGPAARQPSPWWGLIHGLIDEWEGLVGPGGTGAGEALEHFAEAFHECGREPPGAGVTLRTLHGAKGLEFRHVLLIDPGAERTAGSDPAEERRLFYVGMTRARETLTVLAVAGAHSPFAAALARLPAIDRRDCAQSPDPAVTGLRCSLLGLSDVFLDFAGQRADGVLHATLDSLRPGQTLRLRADEKGQLALVTSSDIEVARLSQKGIAFWRPRLNQIETIEIHALIRRDAHEVASEWRSRLRQARWLLPLCEIWWRPDYR